jgi:AraC-like DNA-binding protein
MNQYTKVSFDALCEVYQLHKRTYGNGTITYIPALEEINGWISQMRPAAGLFVSSAWFTPDKTLVHSIESTEEFMWIINVDCGDIIYSQQGKPSIHLTSGTHVIVNPKKKFRFTFPLGIHACFTSVLIFDEYLQKILKNHDPAPLIRVEDAKLWSPTHYDTPSILLILEQIRWGVRNSDMPLLAFEGMVIHLLSAIARNYPNIASRRESRRNYVTWENEQKIYQAKKILDEDILHPKSLKELCKLTEMSESMLRLSFKNLYQITIAKYIRTEIMKKAMLLLSSDHLSIRDIAEQCGYKNPAKFAAAFKEIHGITPSEFRKAFNL